GAREPVPHHLQPAGEPGEAAGYDRTRAQAREIAARTVAGIEIRSLRKHFGDLHAVDGVDLSIRDGEFLVLLGSSGSGKTTLLRMIAGLERPTSGEIHIGDRRVDGDVPPRARGIAMVFQSYALYPHRTVFQNIAFPLEASRTPRQQIEEKVRWAWATASWSWSTARCDRSGRRRRSTKIRSTPSWRPSSVSRP